MAIGKNVKGITIEFNADTTKLGTAMKQVNAQAKGVDAQLKAVDKALKFNPRNTELLAQKQTLLKQKIGQTKDQLELLKQAQAKLDDDPAVDKTSQDYMELRREIIETESKLKHFEGEVQKLEHIKLTQTGEQFKKVGDKMQSVGKKATQYVTAPIVGAFGASVKVTMDFDSAMSQVAATMGKTNDDLAKINVTSGDFSGTLRELAVEMGSKTKFSATEAAEALNYMALAGYDAQTSADMLPGVLNLAAAGNMDLAAASDMVTDSQTALGLNTEQTSVLIDQMARTSSKSNTSVEQLGDAILTVGGTARNMAGGTEELNAVLGVLADNGIKGSEGGTVLRNMLLSLGSPTDKAAEQLDALGVSVYDAEGNMKDMRQLIPELSQAMDGMTSEEKTKAISTIFNKTDLKGVNALLGTSTDRWSELSGAIGDAGGAAEDMAETQIDNLEGSITLMQSALQGAAIKIGDLFVPYVRKAVDFVAKLADKFSSLSPTAQKIIVVVAGIAAAIGPLLVAAGMLLSLTGSALTAIPKIIEYGPKIAKGFGLISKAFTAMKTALFGNPWLLVAAAAIAAIVLIVKNWDKIKEFFIALWAKVKEVFSAAWGAIKGGLLAAWEAIKSAAMAVFNGILAYYKFVFNLYKTIILTVWNAIKTAVLAIWNGIKTAAVAVWNGIKTVIINPIKAVWTWLTTTWNNIKIMLRKKMVEIQLGAKQVWNNIKNAITAPIKAVKDWLANAWTAIRDRAKNGFQKVKDAITAPIQKAKDIIKGIIDKIKGFFDFDFRLPNIELPHFSISPPGWSIGDLLDGVIPSLGIDWYAKGGIFTRPTVAGVGDVRGGEAALPLDPFWKRMDAIVEAVESGGGGGDEITINVYTTPGMDVQAVAQAVEQRLTRAQKQRQEVWR